MSSSDQREHERYAEKLAVDVHVFVLSKSQSEADYEAKGKTVDISRGGCVIRLDKEVPEGVQVRLRFWEVPPGVKIWPLTISGTMIRLEPGEASHGDNMVGAGSLLTIEFTEPLEDFEFPRSG